jgi:hypothetical protein
VGLEEGLRSYGMSHPLPGFEPKTVQPVASSYTDYAIPAAESLQRQRIASSWSKILKILFNDYILHM